jgi:hypothetical protein
MLLLSSSRSLTASGPCSAPGALRRRLDRPGSPASDDCTAPFAITADAPQPSVRIPVESQDDDATRRPQETCSSPIPGADRRATATIYRSALMQVGEPRGQRRLVGQVPVLIGGWAERQYGLRSPIGDNPAVRAGDTEPALRSAQRRVRWPSCGYARAGLEAGEQPRIVRLGQPCIDGMCEMPMIEPSGDWRRATVWPHGSSRRPWSSENPRWRSSSEAA